MHILIYLDVSMRVRMRVLVENLVRCRFRDMEKEKEGIENERKRLSIETSSDMSESLKQEEV